MSVGKIAPAVVVGEKAEKGGAGLVSQGVSAVKTAIQWKPDPKKIKKNFVRAISPVKF